MYKKVPFYTLKLGDEFYLDGNRYIKIELYDSYEIGLNIKTFRIRYIHSSERGLEIRDPGYVQE